MENTGDNALLAVAAWGARRFLKADIVCATAAQVPEFRCSESIRPVFVPKVRFKGENRLRLYSNAILSGQIIFGGGSNFFSAEDMKKKINLIKLSGKGPHAAVGVSLGPFIDVKAERACAGLLNNLSYVGLRDKASMDIANSIAPRVFVEKTFDLSPLLPSSAGLDTEKPGFTSVRKGIGLALCNYERFTGGDVRREALRREKIIGLFEHLDPDDGEIVFIDFNGHHYYGDKELHSDIVQKIGRRFKVRHLPYSPDPIAVLREVAGLRAIIAMRLHAAIFGYMTQTPTVMLSYHPKCLGWAAEIGMPSELVLDSSVFDVNQLVSIVKDVITGSADKPALQIKEAERLAMKNWEWTDA